MLTCALFERRLGRRPMQRANMREGGKYRERDGEKESRMKEICRYSKQPQKSEKHRQVQDWEAY